ncbi:hypothetical protein EV193_103300 [Herbihabitans rhizosphaerae]|uniref:Galactose oxidase-like protein n=1 Tax=Herbihabitans rhizosphaerae TaxID=1872711 RepID=A0A4Q7KZ61_9PSEU|nr:hypothetical protein [Herbihabitans rhizosphaerae]RZS40982.1 hypothetical protein EV193_103300 [Herbihabitans rhizosphaerae]
MKVVVRAAVAGIVAAAAVGLAVTSGSANAQAGWTPEPVPTKPDESSVLHTAASGDGTTWAFGLGVTHSTTMRTQAFLRGKDGWAEVPTPPIGQPVSSVVLSRDDAWVTGVAGKYGISTSMHWDGRAWTEVPLAPTPPNHFHYGARLGVAGSDVWLVSSVSGAGNSQSNTRGTAQRWVGTKWVEAGPPGPPGHWTLSSAGGVAPDDMWAIGVAGEYGHGPGTPLAFHWDGKAWTPVPMPVVDGAPDWQLTLVDVHATAPNDVWVAGSMYPVNQPTQPGKPIMFHWDGKQWTAVRLPVDTGRIKDLVSAGDKVWAFGADRPLRYDGSEWQVVDAPEGATVVAGTAIDGGALVGVGSTGGTGNNQPFAAIHRE